MIIFKYILVFSMWKGWENIHCLWHCKTTHSSILWSAAALQETAMLQSSGLYPMGCDQPPEPPCSKGTNVNVCWWKWVSTDLHPLVGVRQSSLVAESATEQQNLPLSLPPSLRPSLFLPSSTLSPTLKIVPHHLPGTLTVWHSFLVTKPSTDWHWPNLW